MLDNHTIPPERWFYTVPLRLRALFRRRQLDHELTEELESHLEDKTQEYMESGMSAEEAHFAALRDFGNFELAKQNCRDARKILWIQNLIEDFKFGLRSLRKAPGFTTVAVLTLALAIGANTVVFSVMRSVLLRPLPYAHPESLVFLCESAAQDPTMFISLANLADWQSRNTVFASMGGFRRVGATLVGRSQPQHILAGQVTAELFPTLGVGPLLGRTFTAEEDKPKGAAVALLSQTLWEREFASDPTVLGRQLKLDNQSYTIVGVIANGRFPLYWRQMDVFTSLGRLTNDIGGEDHRAHHIGVSAYARLKPGVTVEQARREMLGIARQLEQEHPHTNAGQSVVVQPLRERMVGEVRRPLELLMGAVALVLLIACANVASLLTSRAIVRRREIAIRGALGAGVLRLTMQLLCESTPLALLGGGLGLILAFCAMPVLAHCAVSILPRAEDLTIDGSVLIFTLVISIATGIVFGVVPALAAFRSDPTEAFKESRGPQIPGLRSGLRSLLATAELAMALVLLIGAGLTIKSLFHVLETDMGMQTDGVLTGMLNLQGTKYQSDGQRASFVAQVVRKITALPDVSAAGLQSPQLEGGARASFRVEGYPTPENGQEPYSDFSTVTPGAMEALGLRLLHGRFFAWSDGADAPPVAIVDDTLAARFWPGEDAIGKRIATEVPVSTNGGTVLRKVVGVVHRVRTDAAEPRHFVEIFVPYAQFPGSRGRLIVRSQRDPSRLLLIVRNTIHSLDADLPLYDTRSLAELLQQSVAERRLIVVLLSVFAAIAMVLAVLGVYGVMTYMVSTRTREIGVRVALGASRGDIVRLILAHAMPVIVAGTIAGSLGSLVLSRLLSALLFEVSPTDPGTIAAGALLLTAVALAACCVPVRMALAVDPVRVLQRE